LGTPIASIDHAVSITIQSNAAAPGIHGHACRRTQTAVLRVNNAIAIRTNWLALDSLWRLIGSKPVDEAHVKCALEQRISVAVIEIKRSPTVKVLPEFPSHTKPSVYLFFRIRTRESDFLLAETQAHEGVNVVTFKEMIKRSNAPNVHIRIPDAPFWACVAS
jgi:hypothetical protein